VTGAGSREPPELFRTLDTRGWEPPEPLVRVLEALDALPRGNKIVVLLDLEPRPLFRILKMQRFDYRSVPLPAGHFEVSIWRAADASASPGSAA
jgi:uncharacterized protein (DUF2249 family)